MRAVSFSASVFATVLLLPFGGCATGNASANAGATEVRLMLTEAPA